MLDSRTTFLSAATAFTDQVARIPPDRLTEAGLGDWDLRALVGHTSRSLVTVETYLDQPATDVDVPSAADYYLAIAAAGGASGPEIVERGRRAGHALGDDPAAFVTDLATRVRERVADVDATYVLTTIAGGMRLEEYLRTRTFELVVHGLDAAAAGGVPHGLALEAVAEATTLVTRLAVALGDGEALLRALTGRGELPPKFTVLTT